VRANEANDQRPYGSGDVENGPVMARMLLAPSSGSSTSAAFTAFLHTISHHIKVVITVKSSHTRYRALGPELIPVYGQSARR